MQLLQVQARSSKGWTTVQSYVDAQTNLAQADSVPYSAAAESVRVVKAWFLYVVLCADGTLYTGVSTDVERRVTRHNAGQGAKYTRTRRPVELLAFSLPMDHSTALKVELAFKKMSREKKHAALKRFNATVRRLSKRI